MNFHFFILFGIFLHNNFPTESKKVNPDGIVYEAFKGDAFRRITSHIIETHIVNKLGSCSFRCVKNLECVSFNFGNRIKGKHDCQLLRTDKYNSRLSYTNSADFHYFYPVNKCTSSPCLNNGACYPDYDNNDYHCVCNLATGKNCETLIIITPCTSMPCKNGGTCTVTSSSTFTCTCVHGFIGLHCQQAFRDCSIFHKANPSSPNGVYTIQPDSQDAFNVSCDMTTDGGGWTVFQKRIDGSVSFERGWADYKTGFGNLNGEYWLGNDYLHRLTKSFYFTLRILVHDWVGRMAFAEYSVVTIGDETTKYILTLKGVYKGDDGNAMTAHNNKPFSTFDSDNDDSAGNCAADHKGGFWYKSCIENGASPNGAYLGNVVNQQGIVWKSWKNTFENMKTVQMMLRPANYDSAIKDKNGKACSIPFTYKGVDYYECTKVGSFWGKPWCSFQYEYIDSPSNWGYCP